MKSFRWWWWWWWEVGTIDSSLVLRLGLDWTGLGLGLDNYWDKNAVTNLSDKDTKYSVKGLVYTLKPKTMTDIIKNPGKELK